MEDVTANRNATAGAAQRTRRRLRSLQRGEEVFGIAVRGFFVYCLWGENRHVPLYVGMSSNVLSRLGTHMQMPNRRNLIERVTLIRCRDERDMRKRERDLIAVLQPPLNIAGIRSDYDVAEPNPENPSLPVTNPPPPSN